MDEPRRRRYSPDGHHIQPPVRKQLYSGAEARNLLERELAALSLSLEQERPVPLPHPSHMFHAQRRASPVLEYLPGPPSKALPRHALVEKPIRPGSLMAALSAARPSASDLPDFDEHAIEMPARPATVSRWRLLRPLVAAFGLAFIGLAGYVIFNRGSGETETKPPETPAPAIVSSGFPANVPLPVRRPSVWPKS
jgi:hypothetical protein